jgi:hypothetical protein
VSLPHASYDRDLTRGGTRHPGSPTLLVVCSWLLMLTCFTMPGRSGPLAADALDGIALLKLSVRVGTLAVLSLALLRSQPLPHRSDVLFGLAPLGLFVAWSLLSTAWSPLKSVSLGQSAGLAALFLLTLTAALVCRDETHTRLLLKHLETGLLVFCGLIVMANRLTPQLGSLDRADPGLVHPTAAASAASLGLVLLVACRLLWGWRWTRVQLVAGVAIYTSLLLLAANRTTLLLSVTVLGTLAVSFGGRRLAGITLLVASVFPPSPWNELRGARRKDCRASPGAPTCGRRFGTTTSSPPGSDTGTS